MTGIDEKALEQLRSRIGREVSVSMEPYLTEVTFDAIRHWAQALGDRNPLWRDGDFARRWGHADVIAPPTILFAFDRLAIGYRGGLPGVHSFFGGTRFRWANTVTRNTPITPTVIFKDLIERESKFGGRSFEQLSEITFVDRQRETTIATAESWGMRVSRSEGRSRGKLKEIETAHYSPTEIDAIAAEYRQETVRDEPLLGSDVRVGEEIPSIIRGPYTLTNVVAFEQAWGGLFIMSHGEWFEYLERHPALGLPNSEGVPEPPEAVHWSDAFARKTGVPTAYDYGPERISWLGVMLTNWIGPTGFLSRLDVQVRRFNLLGDLTRCHATVTDLRRDGSRWVASLDVFSANQRGEKTALGTAEVLLATSVEQGQSDIVGDGGSLPTGDGQCATASGAVRAA
jgi:acyl dehydratase